jgi:hypothetical protein
MRRGNQSLGGRRRADDDQTPRGRTHRPLCQAVSHRGDVFALRNERSSSRTQKFVTVAPEPERSVKGGNGINSESSSGFMPDADLARAREGATDAPLPHRAPGPQDDSTRPDQPPTREAEHPTPGLWTRHAGGPFSQTHRSFCLHPRSWRGSPIQTKATRGVTVRSQLLGAGTKSAERPPNCPWR